MSALTRRLDSSLAGSGGTASNSVADLSPGAAMVLQMVFALMTILLVVLLASAVAAYLDFDRANGLDFSCAQCHVVATHSLRTFGAWREGKRKFFCKSCHRQWLAARPISRRERIGAGFWHYGDLWLIAALATAMGWLAWKAF